MQIRRSLTLLMLPALLIRVPAEAQNAQNPPFVIPDSVQMLSDIVYATSATGPLKVDLFVPRQSTGPVPGIVFIACGGWRMGNKSQFWRQSAYLATRGFVSGATQCRPSPGTLFPDQVNDATTAVRWLRDHSKEYGIDIDRIAIAGASAGGHLAALVGTNRWSGTDWSGAAPNTRVRAAVVFNGVFDAPGFDQQSIVRTNLTTVLGAAQNDNPSLWLTASPLHHVTAGAASFLLLHGTNDVTVPYEQSLAMQRRLLAAGVKVELFSAEAVGHGFFNRPPWYEPSLTAVAEFLNRVFR
jgi:acetyl esterase/lipase